MTRFYLLEYSGREQHSRVNFTQHATDFSLISPRNIFQNALEIIGMFEEISDKPWDSFYQLLFTMKLSHGCDFCPTFLILDNKH